MLARHQETFHNLLNKSHTTINQDPGTRVRTIGRLAAETMERTLLALLVPCAIEGMHRCMNVCIYKLVRNDENPKIV